MIPQSVAGRKGLNVRVQGQALRNRRQNRVVMLVDLFGVLEPLRQVSREERLFGSGSRIAGSSMREPRLRLLVDVSERNGRSPAKRSASGLDKEKEKNRMAVSVFGLPFCSWLLRAETAS